MRDLGDGGECVCVCICDSNMETLITLQLPGLSFLGAAASEITPAHGYRRGQQREENGEEGGNARKRRGKEKNELLNYNNYLLRSIEWI